MLTVEELRETCLDYADGCEAVYYRLTKKEGIKVFKSPFLSSDRHSYFTSIDELILSDTWREVQRQLKVMKYMAEKRRGPRVYDLFIVKNEERNSFLPAVRMEHVSYARDLSPAKLKARFRIERLLANRIGHDGGVDGTPTNLVFDIEAKRFKLIDFGVTTKDGSRSFMRTPAMWPSNIPPDFTPVPRAPVHEEYPKERIDNVQVHNVNVFRLKGLTQMTEYTNVRVGVCAEVITEKKSETPLEKARRMKAQAKTHFGKFQPHAEPRWQRKKLKEAA